MFTINYRSGLVKGYAPNLVKSCVLITDTIPGCTVIVSSMALAETPYCTLPKEISDKLKQYLNSGYPVYTLPRKLVSVESLTAFLKSSQDIDILSLVGEDFTVLLKEAKAEIERFKNGQS